MKTGMTDSLTINDVLATNLTELSDEELLSVYGGSFGSVGAAGIALGGVIIAAAPILAGPAVAPIVAAFGVGFAAGSFVVGLAGY